MGSRFSALVGRRPLDLVFAAMADKPWDAMLMPLLPHVRRVIVTRVGRRSAAPDEIARAVGGRVPVDAIDDARAALRAALSRVDRSEAVLVTGSLFLVGEAYAGLARTGGVGALFEPWQPPRSGGTEAGASRTRDPT